MDIDLLKTTLLPVSLESERVILSNLLSDPTGEAFDVCSKLKPHHFLLRSHAVIFETMLNLVQDSKTTDLVTVGNALKSSGKLEEAGGFDSINKIFSSHLTIAHSSQHVEILLEKYRLRKIIDLCEIASSSALKDYDSVECLGTLERAIYDLTEDENSNDNQFQTACDEVRQQIEVRRRGGEVSGLISGVKPFDSIFFGFQPHQMYVLGGMPSSGKTAMADQICGNLLMKNKSVLYISLESDRERVIGKLACKLAEVPFWNFKNNRVKPEDLDKIESILSILQKKELVLLRPFDISPLEVRSLIRKHKRQNDIDLVIVDYLQKFSIPSGWDERRTASRASSEIQRSCIETGTPALVLCQLNREVQEGNRPSMRNLKESSQIEQDADNIALIWSSHSKRDLDPGEIDFPCVLSVDKNKDGASGMDIGMNFEMRKMIFK